VHAACPTVNGTTDYSCKNESCKFDDCHFKVGRGKRNTCEDVGPDLCRGTQRKHGKNAHESVGGPGKKAQYNAKVIPASRNSTEIPCECVNKKGHPVKKCMRCQSSVPNPPLPSPSPSLPPPSPSPPPPGTNFLKDNVMTMQNCSVKYTPSTSNDNWTQLCQIAAQARSFVCGAGQPDSNGDEIPNFDLLLKLWQGQIAVPNICTLYNNWAAAATFTSATTPAAPAHKPPAPPTRLGGGHLREPHAPHEVPGEGVPQVHLRGGGLRQVGPVPP